MLLPSQAAAQVRSLLANAVAAAKAGESGSAWSLWQQASAIAGSTNAPQAFNQELGAARIAVAGGRQGPGIARNRNGTRDVLTYGLGCQYPRTFLGDATTDGIQLNTVKDAANTADAAIAAGDTVGAQDAITYMQGTTNTIQDTSVRAQAQMLVDAETAKLNSLGPQQTVANQQAFNQQAAQQTNTAVQSNGDATYVNTQGNLSNTGPSNFLNPQSFGAGIIPYFSRGGAMAVAQGAATGDQNKAITAQNILSSPGVTDLGKTLKDTASNLFTTIPWWAWVGGLGILLLEGKRRYT